MTPNSAYKIVEIKKGIDYAPKPARGESFASTDPVIYSLLCTKNEATEGTVKILTVGHAIDHDQPVEIPVAALKPGVHYNIYLAKLVDDCDGKVQFIGYQYKVTPLTF